MVDWSGLISLVGFAGIGVALLVMGLLSKRLGSVTRSQPYYIWFYIASGLMFITVVARIINIGMGTESAALLHEDALWVLLYYGLPAIATTIGVIAAWRYWSWLLAERN